MSEERHGSGTIRNLALLALGLGATAIIAVSCGSLPRGNGLSWDTTGTVEGNQTERLRITEGNQTERLRIEEGENTKRTWAIVVGLGAILSTAAYIAKKTLERPAPVVQPAQLPAPPPEIYIVLAQLGSEWQAEYDADLRQWVVANDTHWGTVEDAKRLLPGG